MKNIKLSLYIIAIVIVIGLGYKFYVWITPNQQVSIVTTPQRYIFLTSYAQHLPSTKYSHN